MVRSVQTGFLGPVNRNVSQVFSKAESELSSSSNLLLDSEVVQAQRGEGKAGVKLVVRTPSGPKLIIAKKLLIAIPPKVDFLAPFDLSTNEKQVFGKFINAGYSVGLIRNSGLPDRTAIANVVEDNTEFNLPVLPGAYSFAGSPIPGLQMVTYGTPQTKHSLPFSSEPRRESRPKILAASIVIVAKASRVERPFAAARAASKRTMRVFGT